MSKPRAFALIPAAGMGKRMGASMNKQYLQLGGKPIVARTLQVFQDSPLISGIILVIPEDEIPYCRREVVEKYQLTKVLDVVPGGSERQHSVMNGLRALQNLAAAEDIILIHDGVRPFIDEGILQQSIDLAGSGVGALVAVQSKDTIKVVRDGVVISTPERSTLWQAQTPQSFRYGQILQAHQQAVQDNFVGTDDCSLFERSNEPVKIITGSYRNIKITTPEDLVLAEAFLSQQGGGQP
ncbi:2-C-methyl-D-erythritol 4-phosphate cytidylyltransferase [Trichlorobacter thiogenes]|uniref:2-C-methyl-D-erythritol 4-phosphate cytidylyltransferase n=1 Tax=Trichlorobacter thiogenes TaxID=115783 RepID=A0A1T4LSM0_9BACT|nr:2-C-methyl-D-erythritol 4-phosphate cytidylyltransferase [Trichlorobacter thiogenes]SJZ57631.1 2-C-methyl-D-erythritol 4-phosphate cytidylyltransferase [Trichlorobacter thiogenes]